MNVNTCCAIIKQYERAGRMACPEKGEYMRYGQVEEGRFVERPNRFIAYVDMEEGRQRVHVKNTGRCRELLVPGATVYLERGTAPGRKTDWDLIAVRKGERLINMDAQAPNRVFEEWARAGQFLPDVTAVRRVVCLRGLPAGLLFGNTPGTAFGRGQGRDSGGKRRGAVSRRSHGAGVKHIRELMRAVGRRA